MNMINIVNGFASIDKEIFTFRDSCFPTTSYRGHRCKLVKHPELYNTVYYNT